MRAADRLHQQTLVRLALDDDFAGIPALQDAFARIEPQPAKPITGVTCLAVTAKSGRILDSKNSASSPAIAADVNARNTIAKLQRPHRLQLYRKLGTDTD